MNPENDILERLETIARETPYYWEVYCERDCEYSSVCWLKEEARIRGKAHDHECMMVKMSFGEEPPDALGFGEKQA